VNILEDEQLRQALKDYSAWPTFPQLYIDGEFFGGCDITIGQSRPWGRHTPSTIGQSRPWGRHTPSTIGQSRPWFPLLTPQSHPCSDGLARDGCAATEAIDF